MLLGSDGRWRSKQVAHGERNDPQPVAGHDVDLVDGEAHDQVKQHGVGEAGHEQMEKTLAAMKRAEKKYGMQ